MCVSVVHLVLAQSDDFIFILFVFYFRFTDYYSFPAHLLGPISESIHLVVR